MPIRFSQNDRESERLKNSPICPRCGKRMYIRDSSYGDFYGCSGFPACDYKSRLEDAVEVPEGLSNVELALQRIMKET